MPASGGEGEEDDATADSDDREWDAFESFRLQMGGATTGAESEGAESTRAAEEGAVAGSGTAAEVSAGSAVLETMSALASIASAAAT